MTTMAELDRHIESLLKQLEALNKRIAALDNRVEARLLELEKRPAHEIHYHTHQENPPYIPPLTWVTPGYYDPGPTCSRGYSGPSTSDPSCSSS